MHSCFKMHFGFLEKNTSSLSNNSCNFLIWRTVFPPFLSLTHIVSFFVFSPMLLYYRTTLNTWWPWNRVIYWAIRRSSTNCFATFLYWIDHDQLPTISSSPALRLPQVQSHNNSIILFLCSFHACITLLFIFSFLILKKFSTLPWINKWDSLTKLLSLWFNRTLSIHTYIHT